MIAPKDVFSSSLAERVEAIFSPKGEMGKANKYEYRKPQQEMAVAVASALEDCRHLVVEAGTGVGKSLAYLIPALLYATEKNRKAVVSTHTINLQEQLFHKDIPLAQKILGMDVPVVLLKGRQNYLCPRRLDRAMRQKDDLFVSSETAELKRLWEWHQQNPTGTLSDITPAPHPKVWLQVCSDPHVCTPRTCGGNMRCCFQRTRQMAMAAPLVVINHSLFFSLLDDPDESDSAEVGYLFPNDIIIFDEAHTMESVASRHLGLSVSRAGLRYLLHRMHNPKTNKGLIHSLHRLDVLRDVQEVLDVSERFFQHIGDAVEFKKSNEVRVTHADLVNDTLSLPLAKLHRRLIDCAEEQQEEETGQELRDCARQVASVRNDLAVFLSQADNGMVYWVERSGRTGEELTLTSAPVDVADILERMLFRIDHTAILTSATLSVGKGLDYFQNRIGARSAEALQLASPFNYAEQMKVFVPRRMPEPKDEVAYERALEHWICHFSAESDGKALVLFTSHRLMQKLTASIRPFFQKRNIVLLSQADATPRHQLLEEFKRDTRSVLFGTDSFWQGVDVPGESLSNVIITRLPFAVPDHPLIQAKLEGIEAEGGDPFRQYSLPEAILKFRQGIGRLIRSHSDRGIVAILDSRILNKPYGKAFLAVLPGCPPTIVEGGPEFKSALPPRAGWRPNERE